MSATVSAPGREQKLSDPTAIRILYASETGNSEQLAFDLSSALAEQGSAVDPERLNDVALDQIEEGSVLLVLTSTTGEGSMPYDAEQFWDALSSDDTVRLDGVRFSVLALGDTDYLDFCQAGKDIDARLAEIGATRFFPLAMCDVEFATEAEAWIAGVVRRIEDPDRADDPEAALREASVLVEAAAAARTPEPRLGVRIAALDRLTAPGADKDVWNVRLELDPATMPYQPGDSLSVLPKNDPATIDALLSVLGRDAAAEDAQGLRERFMDLELVTPTRELLDEVAARTSDDTVRETLTGAHRAALSAFLWDRDLVDLAALADARPFSPEDLFGLLRPIAARSYSISSSPSVAADRVDLAVAVLRYRAHGRDHSGVSSTYFADRLSAGDRVEILFEPNERFRLPADDVPIVMVGPGTGIAPFRAFLQERRSRGASGRNWLFFGCRHERSDYLYGEELTDLHDEGLLTRLDLAFSRDGAEKTYVQDLMRDQGAELFAWLRDGAVFYVCGDASRMARDVDAALIAVVAEHGAMSPAEAGDYVQRLSREGRYLRDVY
jgi:sulfite reductase (NADPH) flavoprotein alpha-component